MLATAARRRGSAIAARRRGLPGHVNSITMPLVWSLRPAPAGSLLRNDLVHRALVVGHDVQSERPGDAYPDVDRGIAEGSR